MPNIYAKVALDKQKHPERFCRREKCLWKVVGFDHATQKYFPLSDCPNGFCPRHRPVTLSSPLVYRRARLNCLFSELGNEIPTRQPPDERDREEQGVRG